ncbi:FtsX-like permease family protein [Boudabousia marimammalium]|uniref:ABC3 transporter permease C-terminal domain-containing protein n=1 Tax=Boudabousia marimammalium TaxID=156892 RepID=A0A1Q5PSK6_9ACTO|nr:FtsX-like permease family protein [Boudabousia marimammalium]OKL50422.1 hypothetical protein BM477_00120 [Boudabousia marimammalium]
MNTISLAGMLTRARLSSRTGSTVLDALSVIAFAVASWLTMTTAGGVWMFHARQNTVTKIYWDSFGMDFGGEVYFGLALVAVGLLTIPLLTLGAGAARLGAGARERRLASLRLIGMSTGQVVVLSILESIIQALIGFGVGLVIYLATLPAWGALSFTTLPIQASEMLLPWWGILAAYLLVTLIAMTSTIIGLRRVSISPLGVAKRIIPLQVRIWRILVLVAAIALILYQTAHFKPGQEMLASIVSLGVAILIFVGAVTIVGPLFLQITMRPLVATSSPARLIAIRRVVSNARGAWRNISAIVLMGLVATIASSLMKVSFNPNADQTVNGLSFYQLLGGDISKGVMVAFAFSLIIGATGTLIQQVSDVYDRAEEARSLIYVGTPVRTLIRARFIQVLLPLMVSTLFVVILGFLPATAQPALVNWQNMYVLLAMVMAGIALTFAALLVTVPIQRNIVSARVRRND